MSPRARSVAVPAALAALAVLASLGTCGCGSRSYGRGVRTLAPLGVRAGWVDFRDFELPGAENEVKDRPLAGIYLRMSTRGRAVVEWSNRYQNISHQFNEKLTWRHQEQSSTRSTAQLGLAPHVAQDPAHSGR